MGGDDRDPPFFFAKPSDAIVPPGGPVPFPSATVNLHHEIELVVALKSGGEDIPVDRALETVFGYAVGVDLTRRDLQALAKDKGQPWEAAKGFDASGPVSAIRPWTGTPPQGAIRVSVNGGVRQDAVVADMIWNVAEIISEASRLDAQLSRAKFEPVDIGAMIDALLAARSARGIERGVQMRVKPRVDGPMLIMGEDGRLERVFENLIDNAISFSPDNGLIEITMKHDGGNIVIQIDDNGPGVPPEARDQVFRRFQSIRPEGEAFGKHSGLGLAIARTIVEGHQGEIAVESRDDALSGARFVVTLPCAEVH
jgi:signal transduction histidine kinase